VEQGGRRVRLDAKAITRELTAVAARRGLADSIHVRDGCAGGCWGTGPNVDVRIYSIEQPGEATDKVAVGWKTYVYSLATLPSLSAIIDENLRARASRPPGR
jgi:hypothetical protein